MNIFKTFLKQFSLITAIMLIISIGVFYFLPAIKISPVFFFILIFLYVVTVAIFKLLSKSMESRLSKFANAYMLVNFGKLVFFTIIIVSYAYLNKEDAISFTLTFFIYYVVITIFEVISLLGLKK